MTGLLETAKVRVSTLGAVVGDFLDKPLGEGGLALSRYTATGVLIALVVAGILVLPQRAARKAH